MDLEIRRLQAGDIADLRSLNALFAEAFDEPETYLDAPANDSYLADLLSKPHVIALAAFKGGALAGGLVAYVLDKVEQARAEVYIYDLAVDEAWRRQGVATALIEALKPIARKAGGWVIYVQADYEDPPAVALYDKLGEREDVLHFDIAVDAV